MQQNKCKKMRFWLTLSSKTKTTKKVQFGSRARYFNSTGKRGFQWGTRRTDPECGTARRWTADCRQGRSERGEEAECCWTEGVSGMRVCTCSW